MKNKNNKKGYFIILYSSRFKNIINENIKNYNKFKTL